MILKHRKCLPGLEELTVCSGRPLPLQQGRQTKTARDRGYTKVGTRSPRANRDLTLVLVPATARALSGCLTRGATARSRHAWCPIPTQAGSPAGSPGTGRSSEGERRKASCSQRPLAVCGPPAATARTGSSR